MLELNLSTPRSFLQSVKIQRGPPLLSYTWPPDVIPMSAQFRLARTARRIEIPFPRQDVKFFSVVLISGMSRVLCVRARTWGRVRCTLYSSIDY